MDPLHDHDDAALADQARFATTLDYDFMKQVRRWLLGFSYRVLS